MTESLELILEASFSCSSHHVLHHLALVLTWAQVGSSLWILSLNSVKKPWKFQPVALCLEEWIFNPSSLGKAAAGVRQAGNVEL